ncbi:hypothetical protein [Paracoccus tegillarcae]|uniref:hypothetical protein n=1 Tax=Paracoccus tegillarcae TaxID=1529068 RepID=UPI0026C161B9
MLRKIFWGLLGMILLAVAAVLIWGPAYVERGLNPLTTPAEGWPVSAEAQALHDRLVIGDWHADPLLWDRNLLKRRSRPIPRLAQGNVRCTATKSPRGQNYSETAPRPPTTSPRFSSANYARSGPGNAPWCRARR